MIQRRDAVLSADKEGDEAAMQSRLYDLQRYSAEHMNASTGVIYLQEQYNRDWQKTQDAALAQSESAQNIYKKIEDEVCGPQARANGWRWPNPQYIACQRAELAKYPQGDTLLSVVTPPNENLYRHTFIAPVWSPDFAGFSVLITGVVGAIIVLRFFAIGVLQIIVRWHDRRS